jgi:hypothetical protein
MTASLVITSVEDEAALELSADTADFFIAELRSHGVVGRARVGWYMAPGLDAYFADMASSWKGWVGEKRWRSFEGEFSLTARADRLGHVRILAELIEGAPSKWELKVNLVLEAGSLEQLASLAREFWSGADDA